MTSFVSVEQISGFGGAPISGPPVVAPPGNFSDRTTVWLDGTSLAKISELEKMVSSIRPPIFEMKSPQGTPLSIEPEGHLLVAFSLALDQAVVPEAKFKVMKDKVKNKRKMVATLAQDGSPGLMRDDQRAQPYTNKWASPTVEVFFLALRHQFCEICKQHPDKAKAIQSSLLQRFVAASGLCELVKGQIQQYCYSTNAWISLQNGIVSWKVLKHELEVDAPEKVANHEVSQTIWDLAKDGEGADPAKRLRWDAYPLEDLLKLDGAISHEMSLADASTDDGNDVTKSGDKSCFLLPSSWSLASSQAHDSAASQHVPYAWQVFHPDRHTPEVPQCSLEGQNYIQCRVKNTFFEFGEPRKDSTVHRSSSCPSLASFCSDQSSQVEVATTDLSEDSQASESESCPSPWPACASKCLDSIWSPEDFSEAGDDLPKLVMKNTFLEFERGIKGSAKCRSISCEAR